MAQRNWRVDYQTRDGWTPFWFYNKSTANDAFLRWGRFHVTRLVHIDGDKAEVMEVSNA